MCENRWRLVKALSYSTLAFVLSVFIGWLLFGKIWYGLELAVINFFVKSTAYYGHEWVWSKLERKDAGSNESRDENANNQSQEVGTTGQDQV